MSSLLADPDKLRNALLHSREYAWELSGAAYQLMKLQRYEDALQIFDSIIEQRTLPLSCYCNALWAVQRDNTGLPTSPSRAQRYLDACLPHAPMNPAIHLNAAGVLMELGEYDRALDEFISAARREIDVRGALDATLVRPLRRHGRWHELEQAALPPNPLAPYLIGAGAKPLDGDLFECYAGKVAAAATPAQVATALVAALDDNDPRLRQKALRQLLWWRHEDGDDGHGRRAPPPLLHWYEELGCEIEKQTEGPRILMVIGHDLDGPYVHLAARNLYILTRCGHHFDTDLCDLLLDSVGPQVEHWLRRGDAYVKRELTDALTCVTSQPQTHVAARRYVVPALIELITSIAALGSISDCDKAQRDQLGYSIKVLQNVAALEAVSALLATIVKQGGGEVLDCYLGGVKRFFWVSSGS